jgi:hypothetical protein
VCGPPCAGKTTYVLERAAPGDLVVDHDLIARDLGSMSSHSHGQGIRNLAEWWVRTYLAEIEAGMHPNAWVVRTLAFAHRRAQLAERLGAQVVLLDPGVEVCRERAQLRPRPETTVYAINRWYAKAGLR